ncbi:unnamed protein product [Diamesa serratosioi]
MNKLPKLILVLFEIAILQTNCAEIGRFLHVFETVEDSMLILDKLFFMSTFNARRCGEYQIFCDWLYNSFKGQNNLENVIIYDLTITKTIEYMFFFKKRGTGISRKMGTNHNCGEYGQVCEFLDSYEDLEDLPDIHHNYTNESRTLRKNDYTIEFD